jgi:hypothetical protein
MNTSLARNVAFWILVGGSLATTLGGGWLVADRLGVMTTTLTDGSATGIEVYVGQSLIVVGAALLAAGILGLVTALALGVVRSFIPAPAPVMVEPIEWADDLDDAGELDASESESESGTESGQKGSSGSTAMATKSSVR